MHDVLVVGGGPVGNMAAATMAGAGLDVVLVEEHSEIGSPMDCTGILGVEAFDRFALPREAVVGELRKASLVSPRGLRVEVTAEQPIAYVVDRTCFDQTLASLAISRGVRFHLGSRVHRIEKNANWIEAWIVEGQQKVSLQAKAVVLASGVHYRLQRQLGMGHPAEFVITAQAEVRVEQSDVVEVYFSQKLGRGSFTWYVPFARDSTPMVRVGLLTQKGAMEKLRSFLERPEIAKRLREAKPHIRCSVIPIRPLQHTTLPRVVAVGDAAGLAKPTTGGGIYYGLISAQLAAETIVSAFDRSDFSAESFAAYERRWQRELGRELLVDRLFRRLASELTDQEIDRLFSIVGADGLMPKLLRRLRFDWHKDAIITLLKKPSVASILVRALFRSAVALSDQVSEADKLQNDSPGSPEHNEQESGE